MLIIIAFLLIACILYAHYRTLNETKDDTQQETPIEVSTVLQSSYQQHPSYQDNPEIRTAHYDVAGLYYHQEALEKAIDLNPLYTLTRREVIAQANKTNQIIPKYDLKKTYDAMLVPEPNNEFDPEAIKIIVSDQHIGYIRRRVTSFMDNIIECKIESCKFKLKTCDYKSLVYNAETEKYSLTSCHDRLKGSLTIKYHL